MKKDIEEICCTLIALSKEIDAPGRSFDSRNCVSVPLDDLEYWAERISQVVTKLLQIVDDSHRNDGDAYADAMTLAAVKRIPKVLYASLLRSPINAEDTGKSIEWIEDGPRRQIELALTTSAKGGWNLTSVNNVKLNILGVKKAKSIAFCDSVTGGNLIFFQNFDDPVIECTYGKGDTVIHFS